VGRYADAPGAKDRKVPNELGEPTHQTAV